MTSDIFQVAHRQTVAEFGRLRYGDFVKVTREQGTFKVLSFVLDDGAVVWVNLYGGKMHHEMFRAMTYDRIKIPSDRQLAKQRSRRRKEPMKRFIIPATLLAGAATLGGLGLTASGATAPVVTQPKTPIVNIPSAPKAPVVTVTPSAPAVPPVGTLSSGSTNTVTQSAPTGSSVTSTVHADSTTSSAPAAAPAAVPAPAASRHDHHHNGAATVDRNRLCDQLVRRPDRPYHRRPNAHHWWVRGQPDGLHGRCRQRGCSAHAG